MRQPDSRSDAAALSADMSASAPQRICERVGDNRFAVVHTGTFYRVDFGLRFHFFIPFVVKSAPVARRGGLIVNQIRLYSSRA
jgi:hypothetical protein